MEISGSYDDVLSRLNQGEDNRIPLGPFVHDVELILTTLERMGEGTRSAIADQVSDEIVADYDAQLLVNLLQVLKQFDLVVLDGNTWKPGPKLQR